MTFDALLRLFFKNVARFHRLIVNVLSCISNVKTSQKEVGLATVSVPHGLDGSVIRLTDPSRSGVLPISRTDGQLPDLDPSNTVGLRPLTAVVRLNGCLRINSASNHDYMPRQRGQDMIVDVV